jgi:HK97 family phage major capsid protein
MASKLTKLLEYGFSSPTKQERMRSLDSFQNTLGEETYKTLMQTEAYAINASTLVQEEVYRTVIEGTEPFRCLREVTPVVATNTYSVRFVKGENGTYAGKVAEGSKVPIDTQTYTKQDITIDKWGTRPVITNELIEDSLFDIIELELKKSGARMENALNRRVLYQMIAGSNAVSTNSVDPGASTKFAVRHIAQAIAKIKGQNYMPDIMMTHPHAEGSLLEDSNLAYVAYAGSSSPLNTGQVPKIMGLTPYTCTVTEQATPTWDNTNAGTDIQALIFSKADFATIVMRRDITIEDYEDPIHDLMGIAITMRFGTDVLREASACKMLYRA